jgi:F0F1-type ATP synthase assembly protein I
MAQAMVWSSRITTVSLEMVLPAVLGHWLDQRLGTGWVFVILGAIAGMTAGLMHLIRMTSPAGQDAAGTKPSDEGDSKP